jgi:Leucine-rich repeat (LRR) protein
MELKTFFWLHFWFLSATILLPVYSVEYISCPANCTCVTKEEKYLRLYVQCHDLTLDVAPISTNSSLVHVLDLSRNGIKVLSSCFLKGYDNVVILFLKNSKIESIKSLAFHSLQHLESIDLSYNSFALVPPNLFINNRKLKHVSLSNNELTMLKEDVPILKSSSLLHLDLSNCKLSDVSHQTIPAP